MLAARPTFILFFSVVEMSFAEFVCQCQLSFGLNYMEILKKLPLDILILDISKFQFRIFIHQLFAVVAKKIFQLLDSENILESENNSNNFAAKQNSGIFQVVDIVDCEINRMTYSWYMCI